MLDSGMEGAAAGMEGAQAMGGEAWAAGEGMMEQAPDMDQMAEMGGGIAAMAPDTDAAMAAAEAAAEGGAEGCCNCLSSAAASVGVESIVEAAQDFAPGDD
jgi:hypothetical protein